MKVQKIQNTNQNFRAGVKITRKSNMDDSLLFNKVKSVVDNNKLPAVYMNDKIILPETTKDVLNTLKKMNIKYSKDVAKK